ncbi:MAG: efflux RND transporter periplasmic adaptor subunit [Gammaproteobacteria bacterium]
MPRLIKLTLAALVLVALAAGGRVYLARESAQPGSAHHDNGAGPAPAAAAMAPRGVAVTTVPVRIGIARVMVDAVGSLLADEAVVVRPEIDGRIQSLAFTEGQAVARGDALITLDPAEYEADVAQKEATVDLWQLKFGRARDLMGRKVMSKQDYDEAEASLKVAKAALALARVRLAKTTLRAPFAGILGLRRVSPGDYVAAGKALVNLEAIDPIKVDLQVPERHAGAIRAAQAIAVRVDAFPGREYAGEVYAVDPGLDPATRSVKLRARLPNPKRELRPGMFARGSVVMSERADALWVPEQSLVPLGERVYVYRAVGGKAALAEVQVGLRTPGEVEITAGVTKGDVVVTEGQSKLRDGAAIVAVAGAPDKG